jgi:2'-5' RNA ligase
MRSLEEQYAEVSERGAAVVSSGRGHRDEPPADGDSRWGISAVLRLPPAVARPIAEFGQSLREPLGFDHIIYPAEELHSTLRSLEAFRADVPVDDEKVDRYVDLLSDLTADLGPIEIAYRGVLPSPVGVLVAGWPADPMRLLRLRAELHESLAVAGLLSGPEQDGPRDLFHASACVFMGPIAEPGAAIGALERNAKREFGTARFDRIEIVRYWRDDQTLGLVSLRELTLAG